MTLEELRVVISAETAPFQEQINRVRGQLNNLNAQTNRTTAGVLGSFKKLVAGIVALKIGQKIGQAITSGIREAMNVEASLQQIKRIMGESTNQFLKWANTQAIAFNMSKGEAIKYGSVFGNLLMTFTKSSSETMKYTEDLLKASSVIASATGRSMTDVMERIRSGLLGNTEAIEDLGVNVNVAMIQSTEAFKKFANGRSWDQLDFQTQQQIRLMAILEQTTKKYGDTVNLNTSSQLQQLVANLNNVKLSLGQAFLPIVRIVLPVLTALAQQLSYVMGIVAQFSEALFGKNIQTGNKQAQNTQAQAKAMTNLGNATEKAGEQAKGALAGFDEINSISNQQSEDSGSSGTGGGVDTSSVMPAMDSSGFLDSVTEVSAKVQEMANGIKASVGKINFEPLLDSFERLKTALKPLTETLFSGLRWFFDNVLVPLGTWTIEDLIPSFLNLLASAFEVINPLIETFKPLGQWFFDNFLKPIAEWTGGIIISVLKELSESLSKIGDWIASNKDVVSDFTKIIVGFFAAWKLTELFAFIEMSGGLIKAIGLITDAVKASTIAKLVDKAETIALTVLYAKDFVVGIGESIIALGKQVIAIGASTAAKIADKVETLILIGLYAKDFVVAIGKNIAILAEQAAAWVVSTAAMVASKIATVASTIATEALTAAQWLLNAAMEANPFILVATLIAGVTAAIIYLWNNNEGFRNAVIAAWDAVKEKADKVWTAVTKWFGDVWGWIKEKIIPVFTSMKVSLTEAFNSIGSTVEKIWTGIVSNIKGGINSVIGLVNSFINKLNSIKISVPEVDIPLVGKVGGFSIGLPHIPEIPMLAKGGIVDSPTLAMIGEAGKEAVVPLENTSFVDKLASALGTAVMAAMQFTGNQGSGNLGDIVIQIDGVTLARVSYPYNTKEANRIGNAMITAT